MTEHLDAVTATRLLSRLAPEEAKITYRAVGDDVLVLIRAVIIIEASNLEAGMLKLSHWLADTHAYHTLAADIRAALPEGVTGWAVHEAECSDWPDYGTIAYWNSAPKRGKVST